MVSAVVATLCFLSWMEIVQYLLSIFSVPLKLFFMFVMVNFMCQFDWNIGWPDIWSNTILGVSVRVSLGKINI